MEQHKALIGFGAYPRTLLFRLLFKAHLINQERLGWWITRWGNSVLLSELRFDVSHPSIHPLTKAAIALERYETQELVLIKHFLEPSLPVIELGGSIGVVASTVNRRMVEPTRHWVIEAHPGLIDTLQKNRAYNGCSFSVLHAAIGYNAETIKFLIDPDNNMASSVYHAFQEREYTVEVPTRTLESIAVEAGFNQFALICDIEGSEFDLLEHELPFLCTYVPWLMIEIHGVAPRGEAEIQEAIDMLLVNNYVLLGQKDNCFCLRKIESGAA